MEVERGGEGETGELLDPRRGVAEDEWDEGGEGAGDGVAERSGDLVAVTVGAGLGEGLAAGGEDDAGGEDRVWGLGCRVSGVGIWGGSEDLEAIGVALYAIDAPGMDEIDSGIARGSKQGIEDGVGIVGGWEELAGLLALELDAEIGEEADGARDIVTPEDVFDGVARGAGVGGFVHGVMGDVAAPAAGDEDFGAELLRAVEGEDAGVGLYGTERSGSPDGGEEAGAPRR